MSTCALVFWIHILRLFFVSDAAVDYGELPKLTFKINPAPDGHRCGVCPTYLQKICAFDFITNDTYIFDNHCVMDVYNCIEGTEFVPLKYEHCVYFGNFAYVHGFKYEDMDYGEDHIVVKNSKKHPDFVRRSVPKNSIFVK